jgi:general secretion pathway protein D
MESKLACVAGVTGPSLKQRIEVIMSNRAIERLSATKKLLLVTASAAVIVAPICIGLAAPPAAVAQEAAPAKLVQPNFKDADILMVAEAVSKATGQNFIIDPRVTAQVTLLSARPMSPLAFYTAFLSILEVYGYKAEPNGDVIKIVPAPDAQQHPPGDVNPTSDEFITEVVEIKNVQATQLLPILRPMVPEYGHLAAYPASNSLIISDRASNVNRIISVIRGIDQVGTTLGP